ncbi:DNA-directed RNA polymerase I subunit RPA1 [Camponotus floridanus]|uniref:DNA-directed RNA polymerase subunit n=2 Tax=Camponotus floridanus TaxID=104421 RepID=E2AG26_CAMFO|nr:DNA-directed RNA polymerase I subunit RPA1 isoform X1 [Camponotus floridanus]EFN67613.1 DNA-directed RNA polymerase I subunit RPA1 [Camponotus floridanus]
MMGKYKQRLTPKHQDSHHLLFSMFTANDIRNLSVTKIRTSLSFNILGHPLKGGLYDPSLGTTKNFELCSTCGYNSFKCPGHFGHIELPVPVVNPLFHRELATLFKLSCLNCFTFQIPPDIKTLLAAKLKLLYQGQLADLEILDQEITYVKSNEKDKEKQTQYICDIIDTYMQNFFNRTRLSQSMIESHEHKSNMKNINTQWHIYVKNVLKEYVRNKVGKCRNCNNVLPKISTLQNKIMIRNKGGVSKEILSHEVIHKLHTVMIMPNQSKEYLRQLWNNEKDFFQIIIPCLELVDIEYPTDIFFFEVIPVLPPIVRPVNFINGQMIEHPQTYIYKNIIQDCLILRNIIQTIQDGSIDHLPQASRLVFEQIRGNTTVEKLHNAWQTLQSNIDHLMDRDINRTPESINGLGLKQILEKKEGIIRMHMMGKRVNFAARSVITPDPDLNIDEIGIPEAFARKLTYPTTVTPWNVVELRRLVLNGPDVHPGAVIIENEDGSVQAINSNDSMQREAIAKRLLTTNDKTNESFTGIKIVHRHLQNGDVLLLNRQPTLHKPSIMAHKARVLKGEKTLHLHYANCKAYNADFDGDEMNAHFPQNELARSEGYNIANVCNQYLVPKDGTPLSGLIQDYIIAGVQLTTRGQFFSQTHYTQLVYTALSMVQGDVILLPPTIIKPKPLWSGKQVLSTVIINIIPSDKTRINLISNAKINVKEWQVETPRRWKCGVEFKNPIIMSEAEVVIRHGELLCGVLDKMHYGATSYGLIHCIYELYGEMYASKILSAFAKLFQTFLRYNGFTLGVEDILITHKIDKKRKELILDCRKIGEDVQKSIIKVSNEVSMDEFKDKVEEFYWHNSKFRAQVDHKYKSVLDVYTNDINRTCLQLGLFKKFPKNNLQLMVQSGAKGSMVNTMQISCLLGQSELEGKRPPLMISGKSLSSFSAYDPTPRAGGFIDSRFMTGIKSQECFFHCMAGREGLVDTAVKTSRSGYLQRCLVKHLEGLVIGYDATVRDYDGSLIQFYYGEDGLDIPGSRFLRKEQMAFLADNKDAIIDTKLLEYLKTDNKKIRKMIKKIKKWEDKNGSSLKKKRISEFTRFSIENQNNLKEKRSIDKSNGRSKAALSLMRKWIRTKEEVKETFRAQCAKCPDPVTSKYRQDIEFGVLPERIEGLIDEYVFHSPKIKKSILRDLLSIKIMKSICPPGEPVGLLAAQSIGEPSTQMTLNTFHFSGRGDMNVTLGIPRLREILMIASKNIKTPSMEIPFQNNLQNLEKQAKKLRLKLTKCVLRDVLKDITVSRTIEKSPYRKLVYTIMIEYLPYKSYKNEFSIHRQDVIKRTEKFFFKNIFKEIEKLTKASKVLLHYEGEKRQASNDDALDQFDPDDIMSENTGRRMQMDLGEMHESSDEEEIAEDADATMSRSLSRHQENQEYEDSEEEVEDITNYKEEEADNNNINKNLENTEDNEEDDYTKEKLDNRKNDKYNRKKCVLDSYLYATDYDYDESKLSWCKFTFWLPLKMIKLDLPTIIKNAADKTVLCEIPHIKKAFTFQNSENETILKTDGLNIVEMFKYDKILNLNRLYSNDIYNISLTYGIEAANKVIVREVRDIFKMYGITVDCRHLSLIADYMTFDGTFQPLSRKGMENSASPLQQISFESSLAFLKSATLQGKKDDILSPSSRLMLGQPCKSGTGAFSVLPSLYM